MWKSWRTWSSISRAKVIEWAQKNGHEVRYELLEEHETKGKKIYQMGLMVNGELIASDSDFLQEKSRTKKASEHACKSWRWTATIRLKHRSNG